MSKHFLMCGDSGSSADCNILFSNLGPGRADLLLTDPPYGVDYVGKLNFLNKKRVGKKHRAIENDDLKGTALQEFIFRVFQVASANLRPGASFYIFHADLYNVEFKQALRSSGFLCKQTLIWVKNSAVLSHQDYHWRHEPILYGWKSDSSHRWFGMRDKNTIAEDDTMVRVDETDDGYVLSFSDGIRSCFIRVPSFEVLREDDECSWSILRFERPIKNDIHPTMKPVALLKTLIGNSSMTGEVVYDPFLGSGSTLIACEETGRVCVGMEKDPAYCDLIVRRWEEFTGETATLLRPAT